ncbi:MAG: hypothetical protein KDB53_08760, partial [Planctomycetes bacterium]|nr:hypothetical protein [Planctomycetota bacterium]
MSRIAALFGWLLVAGVALAQDQEFQIRVVSAENRQPVAQAEYLVLTGGEDWLRNRTDLDWTLQGHDWMWRRASDLGLVGTVDDQGEATVRCPVIAEGRANAIYVRQGSLRGVGHLSRRTIAPVDIVIEPHVAEPLLAVVRDASGQLLSGVTVILEEVQPRGRSKEDFQYLAAAPTGPNGEPARIVWYRPESARHEGHAWRLRVAMVAPVTAEIRLPAGSLESGPHEIRVPDCSGLEIRILDPNGKPFLGEAVIGIEGFHPLMWKRLNEIGQEMQFMLRQPIQATVKDGGAFFEHVAHGTLVAGSVVFTTGERWMHWNFKTVIDAKRELHSSLVVQLPPPGPAVVLALTNHDHQPFGGQPLHYHIQDKGGWSDST